LLTSAKHWLGHQSTGFIALHRGYDGGRPKNLKRGYFAFLKRNPALTGEIAEAHSCCQFDRKQACLQTDLWPAWTKRTSEHEARDRGLYAMGNTLERRKKLRRGSAACSQRNSSTAVWIHCWSKALKATKGRGCAPYAVCGVRRRTFIQCCLSLAAFIIAEVTEQTSRGQFQGDEPWMLTVRENPWRAEPQGRYRHETRPDVRARSKPSRG